MITLSFTPDQHATLIACLSLAAQQYADPRVVVETLQVVSPEAAKIVQEHIDSQPGERP